MKEYILIIGAALGIRMELVFENPYVSIFFDLENSILVDIWLENSKLMDEKAFKDTMYVWCDLMQKKQIKYSLTDTFHLDFPLTPEIQDWIVENIAEPTAKNFSFCKQAFVMPREFISSLGIEQLVDESNQKAIRTAYFSDIDSARKWLLS